MKNKYKKILTIALASLSIFSQKNIPLAIAEDTISSVKLIKILEKGQVDWINKVVRVKGKGAFPNNGAEPQKRLRARIAARSDAYRNLAEMINGVQVTYNRKVNDFTKNDNVMTLRVDAVVKGARQTGLERQLPDGSIEVELYLPLFGNGSIASALDLGNYVNNTNALEASIPYRVASLKDFAIPEKISENNLPDKNNISGLIIDASNLAVEPAMSPFLVAGGKVIYAGNKVEADPDNIIKYGVTDYTNSLESAKKDVERIGNRPVIIEASGVSGNPSRTNILLDEITVKDLLKANEKTKFLTNLHVVIVI